MASNIIFVKSSELNSYTIDVTELVVLQQFVRNYGGNTKTLVRMTFSGGPVFELEDDDEAIHTAASAWMRRNEPAENDDTDEEMPVSGSLSGSQG